MSPSLYSESKRIAGSFRDPSSYVFERKGTIYRAIDTPTHDALQELSRSGLLTQLIEEGSLIETCWADPGETGPLAKEHPGFVHFLKHRRLERITYPYEWSSSMLGDAALLTLDIQIKLLTLGFELKDASAFNIQFQNGKPLFIDIGSIQRAKRRDVWFALGQFNRHFLFPLILAQKRGWDLRSYFRSNLDGLSSQQVLKAFPGVTRLSPEILLDVTLPALLERNNAPLGKSKRWEEAQKQGSTNADGLVLNLNRLQRKIKKLIRRHKPNTVWHDYTETCTYDDAATASKIAAIESFLQKHCPSSVLDLGCNSGTYSWLAARAGASVSAIDGDSGAIELVYQRLKTEPAAISPMIIDLGNPSPPIGYLNSERAGFLERTQSDCVFALALIHHLLVSSNLSLAAITKLFAHLCRRYLVVEYVPPTDQQFQRLTQMREGLSEEITLNSCITAFEASFTLMHQAAVENTERTLLFFEKRSETT